MSFKKLMASAMVCAFALTGCGSNTATTSEDKDTFVVGMDVHMLHLTGKLLQKQILLYN